MKYLIIFILCYIQNIYCFVNIFYNEPYKLNCINYNKNFLTNSIKILNTILLLQDKKYVKKWEPPIGYIPESIKNNNFYVKKWEPPIGYIPESIKNIKNIKNNKNIINQINNEIIKNNNDDLYTNTLNIDNIDNIDNTLYIKKETHKIYEEAKNIKNILIKINQHTYNINNAISKINLNPNHTDYI